MPPRLPATVIGHSVRPAASLYAVVRSAFARADAESPACIAPVIWPGGKPTTAVPGLTPRSPVIDEAPVFVTVEPASTANGLALPSTTAAWLQAPVVNVQ